jgi:hypothetical protein
MIQRPRRRSPVRIRRAIAVLLGALLVGLLTAGCSSQAAADSASGSAARDQQEGPATQTSDANQVTIAVTWQGPASGPTFQVALDTHAVDLDGYDLRQLAVLRTSQGFEVAPTGWDAPTGGHHRGGTLTFPTTLADGSPVLDASTSAIELVIREVAGVPERSFRWTL